MHLVTPFKALRPATGRAAEIIAPPYDVLSSAEAVERAAGKPWSFLHISKPEIDLPAGTTAIEAGAHSSSVTANGKPGPDAPGGGRHGINDYTGWFAGDAQMKGNYFGYDGPCPPWNDSIRHRYVFTLFALDIPRVPVDGAFTGQQVREAIAGHILAQASLTGTYSLNPAVPA